MRSTRATLWCARVVQPAMPQLEISALLFLRRWLSPVLAAAAEVSPGALRGKAATPVDAYNVWETAEVVPAERRKDTESGGYRE
jgi:hypothetical protein